MKPQPYWFFPCQQFSKRPLQHVHGATAPSQLCEGVMPMHGLGSSCSQAWSECRDKRGCTTQGMSPPHALHGCREPGVPGSSCAEPQQHRRAHPHVLSLWERAQGAHWDTRAGVRPLPCRSRHGSPVRSSPSGLRLLLWLLRERMAS